MKVLGVGVTSLTSLTPKEEVSAVYDTIATDPDLRLLYGKIPLVSVSASSM